MAESTPGAAAESVSSLTAELKKLKQELATLDPNSQAFQDLANKAGEVKDQMNDAAEAMNANAGSAFEVLGNNASLLTQRLASLDFEGVAQSAKGMAGGLQKVSFKDITSGIKTMGSSFVSLGKALLTNPLLLIGTVLSLIITNFNKIANVVPMVGKVFAVVGDTIGFIIDKIKAFTDLIGLTAFEAESALDNAISSKEKAISELDRQEKRQIALAKKNGQDISKVEKEFAEKRIATYQAIIDKSVELAAKGKILTQEQIDETQAAADAIYDIQTAALEKEAAEAEKAREEKKAKEEKEKQEAINRAKDAAAKAEQIRKETQARQKAVRDAIAESNESQYQNTLSAIDKELRVTKLKYDKLYADAKGNADLQAQVLAEYEDVRSKIIEKASEDESKIQLEKTKATLFEQNQARIENEDALFLIQQELNRAKMSELEAQKDAEIEQLNAAYEEKYLIAKDDAKTEKELADQQKKELANIEEKYRKEQVDKDKDAADKKIETEKQLKEKKIQMASDAIGGLMALNEAFNSGSEKSAKKAFKINKALSMAQAIMSTYQAVNAQLAVPQDAITGANYVKAGISLAAGLANVAKISKTQFESTSAGGGGGGGGSLGSGGGGAAMTSVTPSFNPLNTSFLNNRPAQTGAVQAYVLSSNVSSAMEANQKVKDQTVL